MTVTSWALGICNHSRNKTTTTGSNSNKMNKVWNERKCVRKRKRKRKNELEFFFGMKKKWLQLDLHARLCSFHGICITKRKQYKNYTITSSNICVWCYPITLYTHTHTKCSFNYLPKKRAKRINGFNKMNKKKDMSSIKNILV